MAKHTGSRLRREELKKFGYSFGLGMAILTAVGFWRSFPYAVLIASSILSVFHVSGAFLSPKHLVATFTVISSIGRVLSILITTVFFTAFYYAIFSPIALLYKITGKDVIQKQNKTIGWEDVSESENRPSRIENQY